MDGNDLGVSHVTQGKADQRCTHVVHTEPRVALRGSGDMVWLAVLTWNGMESMVNARGNADNSPLYMAKGSIMKEPKRFPHSALCVMLYRLLILYL